MNGQSVAPLRFIVTPTLKDISDQDREEFDVIEQQPVMDELSEENDQVSGTERYYNYILHSHAAIAADLGTVSGTEGILSSLKNGVKKVIQMVKDFFKWIWSFFSAKEKKIDNKLENLDHRLKDKGVKSGEITYPQSTYFIYPKPGKPVKDLGWVGEANKRVAKGITNVNSYAARLTDLLNTMERMAKDHKPVAEITKATIDFNGKVRDIFDARGRDKATFITTDDFRFGPTKIMYSPTSNLRKDFHTATFTTTQTVVEEIRKETKANLVHLKTLTVDLQKLEKTMVDTLTLLSNSKDIPDTVHKVFSSVVRNALEDIKGFEHVLYRALVTITDVCNAAVN